MTPFARLFDVRTITALLTRAEQESLAVGQPDPGSEHLFLAALEMPDGAARHAFATVGGTAENLRAALAANEAEALTAVGVHAPAAPTSGPTNQAPVGRRVYRSKGSTQDLFIATKDVAKRRGEPLSSAHVIIAACDVRDGTLARALSRMDVAAAGLRTAAEAAADRRGRDERMRE